MISSNAFIKLKIDKWVAQYYIDMHLILYTRLTAGRGAMKKNLCDIQFSPESSTELNSVW